MALDQRLESGCVGQLRQQRVRFRLRLLVPAVAAVVSSWACGSAALSAAESRELEPLKVSDNGRFLVTASGKPFFWLGDTCWHMYGKSVHHDQENQPSVEKYFSNRAEKGFTVIQSVLVWEPVGGTKKKRLRLRSVY